VNVCNTVIVAQIKDKRMRPEQPILLVTQITLLSLLLPVESICSSEHFSEHSAGTARLGPMVILALF